MQRLVKKYRMQLCELVHKCERMKSCQICRGASERSTWKLHEYTRKLTEKILNLRLILADDSTIENLRVLLVCGELDLINLFIDMYPPNSVTYSRRT